MEKQLSIVTSAYQCEPYLEGYFQNITALVGFERYLLIVVLNQPSRAELEIAEGYRAQYPDNICFVPVERESIGASTNRGFQLAETEYLTYADVDDRRAPDCYIRQLQTLQSQPDIDFTYGDFVTVPEPSTTDGELVLTMEFDQETFSRGSHVGPNHFFRRTLLDKCGYWDEQLKSGGDFDFQVRAALNGKFKKTVGPPLLYYTCFANSGSASSGRLQPIERTVIELRYGIYDKIDYDYLPRAVRYNVPYLLQSGQWVPVSQFVPDYEDFIQDRCSRWFVLGMGNYFVMKNNSVKSRSSQRGLHKRSLGRIKAVIQTTRQRIGL